MTATEFVTLASDCSVSSCIRELSALLSNDPARQEELQRTAWVRVSAGPPDASERTLIREGVYAMLQEVAAGPHDVERVVKAMVRLVFYGGGATPGGLGP